MSASINAISLCSICPDGRFVDINPKPWKEPSINVGEVDHGVVVVLNGRVLDQKSTLDRVLLERSPIQVQQSHVVLRERKPLFDGLVIKVDGFLNLSCCNTSEGQSMQSFTNTGESNSLHGL